MRVPLIHANDAAAGILPHRLTALRSAPSHLDPENLVASQFDTSLAADNRTPLSGFTATMTIDVEMNGMTLRISFSPVGDGEGTRLGTVVQWIDRTDKVVIDREVNAMVAG